ncbi:MAG: histidine kinase [Lachnospiraceae bacterium]|nr:histidine kinase [Lachnospiraceae bacterium]
MITEYITALFHEYLTAIVIMIGLTTVFISNNTISKKKKNYLFKIIALDIVLMFSETLNHIVFTPEMEMIPLRITIDIIGYVIRPTLIVYFYLLVSERLNPKFNLLLIFPLIIDTLVCCSAYFTDLPFYYITGEDGTYWQRGPLGFVPFAVSALYLLILIIDSIKYFGSGKEKTSFAVVYSAIVVIVGSIIETLDQSRRIIVNFTMLSTLIYFLMLYFKTVLEQEEEIIRQTRIEVMYSQIGPHFIFNTLSAIYGLVDKNPKKAKEAIATFSDYLRGNIDSIGKKGWVPFEEELKHIDSYVWIEKMRFGDDLTVEYDIDTMDFEVPPLSIQPLVENAIKHGIRKKAGPGKVIIKTREEDNDFIVEVIDDGVGFDTKEFENDAIFDIRNATDRGVLLISRRRKEKEEKIDKASKDGRGHVGLENTRFRLSSSGKANLIMKSEVGKGTTATVTIKKKHEEAENHRK